VNVPLPGLGLGETIPPSPIDGPYRYVLSRRWRPGGGTSSPPALCWVMLNPSTADAETDDPTIARVRLRAHLLGYGGICVLNLFALRSTSPAALLTHPDPVGPDNDRWIAAHIREGGDIVAAWGSVRGMLRDRAELVASRLSEGPGRLLCLGRTVGGHPRHPLYVPYSQGLEPYRALLENVCHTGRHPDKDGEHDEQR
jgi:hypothetical protein